MERGEFDDLPGQGKPLNLDDRDPNWWVKGLLEREQLPMPLPTSLQLRREAREIDETVADCRDEAAVRDVVDALNERILDSHRRRVDGPPVVTAKLDVDAVVQRWRAARDARRPPAGVPAGQSDVGLAGIHPQAGGVHPRVDARTGRARDAGAMNPSSPRSLLARPAAVALRLLAWPLLIELAAFAAARSQDDALGAGLLAFFVVAVLAFVLALVDGLLLRVRPLVLVWSVVSVLVSVVVSLQPVIDTVVGGLGRGTVAEVFGYAVMALPSSLPFLLVMVGGPAALGALSGAALRRSCRRPGSEPVLPSTPSRP